MDDTDGVRDEVGGYGVGGAGHTKADFKDVGADGG